MTDVVRKQPTLAARGLPRLVLATVVVGVLVCGTRAADAAGTPAQQCEVGKNKAAGKYAACRQNAEAKLAASGDAGNYGMAIARCDTKFTTAWSKLEGKLPCPSTGDAPILGARIAATTSSVAAVVGGDRFEDTGLTVIDHLTGLEWEKKRNHDGPYVLCPGGGASCDDPHDADNIYSWSASLTDADGGAFTTFLGQLNTCVFDSFNPQVANTGFAGHCDWHLPTLFELRTIIDTNPLGCGSGAPCIAPIFGDTGPGHYWSSSTSASDPMEAYGVNFATGNPSDDGTKTSSSYVRAVRCGS